MNLAEQMYQKSLENLFEKLSYKIKDDINKNVKYGYFCCNIEDVDLVKDNVYILEKLGFKIKYEEEVTREYYKISWDKESDD